MPDYKNRVLTVDTVIFNSKQEVLLIRRGVDPQKGWWALPGGYLEYGETVLQGALRELREETGLKLGTAEFIGIFDNPDRHPEQRVSVAYFAVSDETPHAGDDAEEYQFFPLANLPAEIAFDHRAMIDAASKLAIR